MALDDAKDIKQLANEARALYDASLQTYQQLTTNAVERATGAKALDLDEVAKDVTTFWGTVARDAGNLGMVWQQLARIATPPAPGADPAAAVPTVPEPARAARPARPAGPAKRAPAAKRAPKRT